MKTENLNINSIHCGDCLNVLTGLQDNSIDLIATDPPYGISFLGNKWDNFNEITDTTGVFGKEKGFKKLPRHSCKYMYEFFLPIWKECLRALKPGGFCFVMCSPRQDVLLRQMKALDDAGFRTDFTSIYWTYASGFPKSINIGKAVDKKTGFERKAIGINQNIVNGGGFRDKYVGGNPKKINNVMITIPASSQAKTLDGSYGGYQPKPAVEVIIVAMKPLSEKTFVDQSLNNKKGITWLDDCRIPYEPDDTPKGGFGGMNIGIGKPLEHLRYNGCNKPNFNGRFSANLLVSDDILDAEFNKKSSFSRFFDLDKWAEKTFPFLVIPKASRSEKDIGCEALEAKSLHEKGCHTSSIIEKPSKYKVKNIHPTVKPIKLMSYLITLGSRENDVVLDPFAGSGTTCVSAKILNRNYIGIEREKEYCKIANARIQAYAKEDNAND